MVVWGILCGTVKSICFTLNGVCGVTVISNCTCDALCLLTDMPMSNPEVSCVYSTVKDAWKDQEDITNCLRAPHMISHTYTVLLSVSGDHER